MTELPSRERMRHWLDTPDATLALEESYAIIDAYAEGRLVELPPMDEMVERAAKALYMNKWVDEETYQAKAEAEWEHQILTTPIRREYWFRLATAMLEAALGVDDE